MVKPTNYPKFEWAYFPIVTHCLTGKVNGLGNSF